MTTSADPAVGDRVMHLNWPCCEVVMWALARADELRRLPNVTMFYGKCFWGKRLKLSGDSISIGEDVTKRPMTDQSRHLPIGEELIPQ